MPKSTSSDRPQKRRMRAWRAKPVDRVPFPFAEKGHRGDPSVSEREYTDGELELLKAMDAFIHLENKPFPTFCDVMAVLISLGYRKP